MRRFTFGHVQKGENKKGNVYEKETFRMFIFSQRISLCNPPNSFTDDGKCMFYFF